MQIVTYLGFTLLSIFIQFSVMDFIQGRLKLEDNLTETKETSQKRLMRGFLKNISDKPYALYYQTQKAELRKTQIPAKFISNASLTELLATTDMTTTVIDILYDENTTTTDEFFTTESVFTTTEIENITEITFFEKSDNTKSDTGKKKTFVKDCGCNFLYRVCDINCCCDGDCLDTQLELFPECSKNNSLTRQLRDNVCYHQLPYFGYGNGLFCIVKSNLPDTQNIAHEKVSLTSMDNLLTWKSIDKIQQSNQFSNKLYNYGDPIWLLRDEHFYHIDLPSSSINNYCTGRKQMQFLKDEKYRCHVKISDLEMFHINKKDEAVISATQLSLNSSILNCTNLHCVNWTIFICNNLICYNYSKSHEPACTDRICTNLALKIHYTFYYHESKIVNATIQLHVENVTMDLPFISQEIEVKFVLANESINSIVKLSGSPGYQDGLPIIISYAQKNYTETFFNTTSDIKRYWPIPENRNGLCIPSNISNNFILFGSNRRIKCRYNHSLKKRRNWTDECKNIQNNINNIFGVDKFGKSLVSPLGNPHGLNDNEWLSTETTVLSDSAIYGEYLNRSSDLICYNLITRYSITFTFAYVKGNNNILSWNYKTSTRNNTFNMEDISTVITVDINFVDLTKPGIIEYATSPHLNIHLPNDFFYPFRSNECRISKCNTLTMILLSCIVIVFK